MAKHREDAAPRPALGRAHRYLVCPACGLHVRAADAPARFGRATDPGHRLTARVRRTGGYKGIVWTDDGLTAAELEMLSLAVRAAAARLDRGGD